MFIPILSTLLLFVTTAICTAQPSPQKAAHFDLKGESIGESLETFKAKHPDARCSKVEPERVAEWGEDACTVQKGVSFAGLPALVDGDCDHVEAKVGDGHNCWEGLSAQFRGGKLIRLSYSVEAEGGQDWAF